MTYRSAPARGAAEVTERVFWSKRFVRPLVGIALAALVIAFDIAAQSRVVLVINPYETPRSEPATLQILRVPAHVDVASYRLSSGVVPFATESTGTLDDFYVHARVVGAAVSLSDPRGRNSVPEDSLGFMDRPRPAPHEISLGPEPERFTPSNERVASAIQDWMRDDRKNPLRVVWWTAPDRAAHVLGAFAALTLLALFLASRTRVRVTIEGDLVHVDFGNRRASLARNEIDKIKVETRVVGQLTFARPVVVTTNDKRRIPVGPRVMTDEAAANLARRIRAIVG